MCNFYLKRDDLFYLIKLQKYKNMIAEFLVVLLLAGLSPSEARIPVVELLVKDRDDMQFGLGWPHRLQVMEGHEALMKIDHVKDPASCIVTTPQGIQFDVRSPPNSRYESWSEHCGLKVKNVVESDDGRWRLNATSHDKTIAGWTEVHVTKETSSYSAPVISLLDGQTDTQVELTTLENTYCTVAQPFSESSFITGHCRVTLPKATRAVQGNWNVLLGLPGRVSELPIQRKVAVEAERLDVGYVRDTNANKIHLYCNILNSMKNITFCRFQKTSSSTGFNIIDGLSDGKHSYYGEGVAQKQCGMTIEQPTASDFGTWRCSVGVQQWVGTTIQQQTPLQALISVGPDDSRIRRYTNKLGEEVQAVFVQANATFTIMCRAEVSLAYCWFQHPNGSQYTPVPIESEEQPFWYTGEGLGVGDCGITFTHASTEEDGDWLCHMGPLNKLGIELTDRVNVRVTGPLAANKNKIAATLGDSVTLYCHSSNGNKPLDYCRFLTPTALGFRIDSTVTEETPILDRFYFTPGRNLDYGDCSLTIKALEEDDFGEWTCAALINDESLESRDTITVYIDSASRAPLSRASIVGMIVGLAILVVALAGTIAYKKLRPVLVAYRNRPPSSQNPMFSSDRLSCNSLSSDSNSDISQTATGVHFHSPHRVSYSPESTS